MQMTVKQYREILNRLTLKGRSSIEILDKTVALMADGSAQATDMLISVTTGPEVFPTGEYGMVVSLPDLKAAAKGLKAADTLTLSRTNFALIVENKFGEIKVSEVGPLADWPTLPVPPTEDIQALAPNYVEEFIAVSKAAGHLTDRPELCGVMHRPDGSGMIATDSYRLHNSTVPTFTYPDDHGTILIETGVVDHLKRGTFTKCAASRQSRGSRDTQGGKIEAIYNVFFFDQVGFTLAVRCEAFGASANRMASSWPNDLIPRNNLDCETVSLAEDIVDKVKWLEGTTTTGDVGDSHIVTDGADLVLGSARIRGVLSDPVEVQAHYNPTFFREVVEFAHTTLEIHGALRPAVLYNDQTAETERTALIMPVRRPQ